MKYEMGRAAAGAAAAGVVLVAGVVIKELGSKARAARASEEYLANQWWAVETAERDVPLQRRAQALLDDDYPLEETREQLSSRRSELSDNDSDDEWTELLARLASAAISSGTRRLGLGQ
jgi:acetyl-CoA carboxylase carboxyltransferase component